MGDRDLFQFGFKQEGDVCLLTSYGFIIEYCSRLSSKAMRPSFFSDLFKGYLSGIVPYISSVLTPTQEKVLKHKNKCRYQTYRALVDGIIVINELAGKDLEDVTFTITHFFCQDVCSILKNKAGGIHGYEHLHGINSCIQNRESHSIGNIELPSNYVMGDVSIDYNRGIPIDEIKDFLIKNKHSLALLLFCPARGGDFHSVVCGYDKDGFYFRDPNCTSVTEKTFNGCLIDEVTCFEFIPISFVGQS